MLSAAITRDTLVDNYAALFDEMNHSSINMRYDLYIVDELAPPQLPTTSSDKYVLQTLAPNRVYDNNTLTRLRSGISLNVLAQQQIDMINQKKALYIAGVAADIKKVTDVITAQSQLDVALETYWQRMAPP